MRSRLPKLAIDLRRLPVQSSGLCNFREVLAMFKHSLTAKRILLNTCLSIISALILSTSVSVAAQTPDYASERQRAFRLLDESKMLEALPILEKLAAQNPDDAE